MLDHHPPFRTKAWRHAGAVLVALTVVACFITRYREGKLFADQSTSWDSYSIIVANYIGDASFALTGSLAAGMEGMDLLGCIIVGFVTALGGGTVREVLLGHVPIWWMVRYDEAVLVVAVAALTFFLWPKLSHRFVLTTKDEWLFWTDTIGLAVFAASGACTGEAVRSAPDGSKTRLHFVACAVCGMMTATFGGVTRDVLIARPPRILYSAAELYAVPALLGGLTSTAVLRFVCDTMVVEAVLCGVWVTVFARVLSVNHNLILCTFPAEDVYSAVARPRDVAANLAMEEELSWKARASALRHEQATDEGRIRASSEDAITLRGRQCGMSRHITC